LLLSAFCQLGYKCYGFERKNYRGGYDKRINMFRQDSLKRVFDENLYYRIGCIYPLGAKTNSHLPEQIKLDREESEKIINSRKQKIYHHPIIQRYLSNNLLKYSHLIKQKNNNKKIYKSSILLKRSIWRLHILSFSKEHYEDFYSNPHNKNIIDDFPLKLL
jgi:hypothetical protein